MAEVMAAVLFVSTVAGLIDISSRVLKRLNDFYLTT